MIGTTEIYGAMLVVAILLVVLSIPSMLLTVRGSSRLLKRYRLLRCIEAEDAVKLPKQIRDEWASVNSALTYATMLSEEMEHILSLRPAMLQAEIGIILIVFLALIPQFETDVLICMIAVLLVVVASIIYGRMNNSDYRCEYIEIMSELESNGEYHDMIYA